jgi:hypothetical protein
MSGFGSDDGTAREADSSFRSTGKDSVQRTTPGANGVR